MKTAMKLISVLSVVVIIACTCALCFVGCKSTNMEGTPTTGPSMLSLTQNDELQTVSLQISAPVYFAGGVGQGYTEQTVTAVILPDTVQDKYVTWSLAWASGASLSSHDVSDYITLEQDGSTTCTLKCYQAFRGSDIILTCRTRQNNKTCTATITYNGIPTSMALGNSQGQGTYNVGTMNVALLYVNSSYTVPITMDNIFNDVGSVYENYYVTVAGVGTLTVGNYSRSPRGAGWGATHDIELNSIVSQLVTCTIQGNKLKIAVNKSISGYCESYESHYVEGNGETSSYVNLVKEVKRDSSGNEPYVVITVHHYSFNLTATYKCFLQESVQSVSIADSTIVF